MTIPTIKLDNNNITQTLEFIKENSSLHSPASNLLLQRPHELLRSLSLPSILLTKHWPGKQPVQLGQRIAAAQLQAVTASKPNIPDC